MELSERQKDILQKAVFEYINRAEPVSSGWLEEQYELPFSPATVRAEMLSLTEGGYLEQPHISSGRIPTDKGYRFFVDELLQEPELHDISIEGDVYEIGREVAEISSSLIILSVPNKSFLWKEGWEQVLQAPEFETKGKLASFTNFLQDIERGITGFRSKNNRKLEIYIGRENPFSAEHDFSIMISGYSFPRKQKGFLALVGPKRMAYQKNIGLLNSLRKIFT